MPPKSPQIKTTIELDRSTWNWGLFTAREHSMTGGLLVERLLRLAREDPKVLTRATALVLDNDDT